MVTIDDNASGDSVSSTATSILPGWFGPAERPRFGCLHVPAAGTARRALIIVPPFGNEALCVHRSLRTLAKAAARAGMLALRFDLDGSGESAGSNRDPDRLHAWLASVDDACNLARASGADDLVLCGLRLGASLATLAAEKRTDVVGLVAINAVISGRKWLREARALHMAMGLTPDPNPSEDAPVELAGFALDTQNCADLMALDLSTRTQRPAATALLIERDDMPLNTRWADHLASLQCDVQQRALPGYADMMQAPHDSLVPDAIIEATVAWSGACPTSPKPATPSPEASLSDQVIMPTAHGRMRSRVVQMGEGLFSILSQPLDGHTDRALVLLNAGGIARVGPNRLFVELAARRVAAGEQVLRIDLSGIGDSTTRVKTVAQRVYHPLTEDDTATIVDWLRTQGVKRIALGGLCSGAYHSWKAALAGQAVDTVLMINPLTFDYQPDVDPYFALHRDSQRHAERMRSGAAWLRLLRGEVAVGRAIRVLAWRLWDGARARLLDWARWLRLPLRNDLGCQLQDITQRGVTLHFIFAREEPAPAMLKSLAGSVVPRLQRKGRCSLQTHDGADHTFTPHWSQPWLLDAIERALDGHE